MDAKKAIEVFKAREPVKYQTPMMEAARSYVKIEELVYTLNDDGVMVLRLLLTDRVPTKKIGGSTAKVEPKYVEPMTDEEKKEFLDKLTPEKKEKSEPVYEKGPAFYKKEKGFTENVILIGEYLGSVKVAEYLGYYDKRKQAFHLYPRVRYLEKLPYDEKWVGACNVDR